MKPIKLKTCAVCKAEFKPFLSTAKVCSLPCSITYARIKQAHKESRELNIRRAEARNNDRSTQLKLTQAAFNKFIRLRDKDEPCISCQRHHEGQYHAGHYLTVGSRPNLRFEEANCHKQCAPCNNHLSGNQVNYRINLIKKLGLNVVEGLESDNVPAKHTIQQLHELKAHYKARCRELERVTV